MTLTEFYAARLNEREAAAKAAGAGGPEGIWMQPDPERQPGRVEDDLGITIVYDEGHPTEQEAAHIALNDPAAVLADIAAKQKILAAYETALADEAVGLPMPSARPGLEYAVIPLATAFADHPDYPLNRQDQAS